MWEDISNIMGIIVKVFGIRENWFLVAFLIIYNTLYIGCFYYYKGASSNKNTLYFTS